MWNENRHNYKMKILSSIAAIYLTFIHPLGLNPSFQSTTCAAATT